MTKPTKLLGASLCLAAAALAPLAADLGENVFANVNGEDLDYAMINLVVDSNQIAPDQIEQVLERLISQMIMAQEAEKTGLGDNDQVKAELQLGRIQVLARSYLINFLEQNPVTDASIDARHQELIEQYEGQSEYHSFHILVTEEDEAKALSAEIGGDKDAFMAKAREVSIDTGSGANGGDLGWSITAAYVPEFASALAALKPGEFSAPVQSQFGWHLIYLDATRPFAPPPMSPAQRQQITEQLQADLINAEVERLTAAAQVVRDDE